MARFKVGRLANLMDLLSLRMGLRTFFLHQNTVDPAIILQRHDRVSFDVSDSEKGRAALNVARWKERSNATDDRPVVKIFDSVHQHSLRNDNERPNDEIEEVDTSSVSRDLLREISKWKREAKAENNDQYFWSVKEVAQIQTGEKYFVIGRKGSGKTAICEHFNQLRQHDVFSEKLSFKNFPFNELYSHKNQKFTTPNQYITLWKYLIYSSVCRLMLKNEAVDSKLRTELTKLYGDELSLTGC